MPYPIICSCHCNMLIIKLALPRHYGVLVTCGNKKGKSHPGEASDQSRCSKSVFTGFLYFCHIVIITHVKFNIFSQTLLKMPRPYISRVKRWGWFLQVRETKSQISCGSKQPDKLIRCSLPI